MVPTKTKMNKFFGFKFGFESFPSNLEYSDSKILETKWYSNIWIFNFESEYKTWSKHVLNRGFFLKKYKFHSSSSEYYSNNIRRMMRLVIRIDKWKDVSVSVIELSRSPFPVSRLCSFHTSSESPLRQWACWARPGPSWWSPTESRQTIARFHAGNSCLRSMHLFDRVV